MAAGAKTGGRRKGVPNKRTAKIAKAISDAGLTPLAYMLRVLRNAKEDPARRAWAAKEAAPYVHPKLAQVELANKDGKPFLVGLLPADGGVL